MDDAHLIALYWQRSESAIAETAAKYGGYCYTIAYRILANPQDSEECVNDTYFKLWESIPPTYPRIFSAFIGKITRRLALNRYAYLTAAKRGGGQVPLALDELSECIPDHNTPAKLAQEQELTQAINAFLHTLSPEVRKIFLQRYWALMPIREIASLYGLTEGKVKMTLLRTRAKFKQHLQKEGITL